MMIFKSLSELDAFFFETPSFHFYGLGDIGIMLLSYLEKRGLANKLESFILTSREGFPERFCGKPVRSVEESVKDDKDSPIFLAVGEALQGEISATLEKHEIKTYSAASDKALSLARRSIFENVSRETNEENVIKTIALSDNRSKTVDALFLSPPYWDVYSPFSAIPSIMGKLKEKGLPAIQVDLGIECFHYLLARVWKPIAIGFMGRNFYKNEVSKYKNNPYQTYGEYVDALWFFQGDEFPLDKVKESYKNMSDVQRGIITCFYQRILAFDTKPVNFNTLRSIGGMLKVNSWDILRSVLLSSRMKDVWENLPQIVGISVTGANQFLPACKLASILKKAKPDIKLILGGSCADLFMESIYPFKREIYDYFDFVVVGEGETAVWKLCECLKNDGAGVNEIPNIAHVNESNEVSYTAQILENVETLPIADYTGLDLNRYMSPRPILPYQASRGCHYGQCAFCNHNEKYRHNYRMKSNEKVVRELAELSKKYKVKDIQFVDEAIRPDHFEQIVDEMEKTKATLDISWFYYSRVSRQYNSKLLQRARGVGCKMVMFGVETLNQRLLNFIKKGILAEVSKENLRLFHENGIMTYAWLMGNLPSETLEELREDMRKVEENISNIDAAAVGSFCLEINTDMYRSPVKYNILTVDYVHPERFASYNNEQAIDKDEMLNCVWNEYIPMLQKHFFYRDRYEVYFGMNRYIDKP